MAEENPVIDPQTDSPGIDPQIEQSILKGANVGGDVKIEGGIHKTVNNQTPGSGSVNVDGNISGSVISVFVGSTNPPPSQGSAHNRHNLPRSGVTKFIGRETELDTLHEKLQQSSRLNIAAIKGMGGIGKSELALQYAYRHRDLGTYPGGLCWLDLRSGDLGGQIVKFARLHLGLTFPDNMPLSDQVTLCWQQWPAGEVLLVYDNAGEYGEVKPFLPPADPRFRVLITSRNRMGSPVETIEIRVLEEGAALELLGVLAGKERVEDQRVDAKELCRRLGYLPLAIELVGRYLAADLDLSITEMLGELEKEGLSVEALAKAQDEDGMTAVLGVQAAFELSWKKLDVEGQQLGSLLSFFAEAPIPWKLVEECLSEWEPKKLTSVRNKQLSGLSLLERLDQGVYQLHPLIREYFGQKREQFDGVERLKRGYCQVMVYLAKRFPQTPKRIQWEGFAPVVPHLAEVADRLLEWVEDKDLTWVFIGLGRYYKGQGAYAQAVLWHKRCLDNCKDRLGDENIHVAVSLNNLAELYRNQGRYAEAEPLIVQALEMERKLLGEEHPDVLISMGNLASLYSKQGRYTEAEPLLVQALEMMKKILGEEHIYVYALLSKLAQLFYDLERDSEAEPLLVQALELIRKLLGEEHPDVAASLHNLAALYEIQRRYSEAEPLIVQALELTRKLLGEEHPDVATAYNNLAELYRSQGRYAEAEPLYLQALELRKKLLGGEHPDVAASLNNLGLLYYGKGDYKQAEPLFVQAFEILDRCLGFTHPTTQQGWNNYMQFLEKLLQERPPALEVLRVSGSAMTREMLQ
jgi:tetratricopeptide (TPR) repeat protein